MIVTSDKLVIDIIKTFNYPVTYISNIYVENEELVKCSWEFGSDKIYLEKIDDKIGKTNLIIEDIFGELKNVEIIVDKIDYEIYIMIGEKIINNNDVLPYYFDENSENEIYLKIVTKEKFIYQNIENIYDSYIPEELELSLNTIDDSIEIIGNYIKIINPFQETKKDISITYTFNDNQKVFNCSIIFADNNNLFVYPEKLTLSLKDYNLSFPVEVFGVDKNLYINNAEFDYEINENEILIKPTKSGLFKVNVYSDTEYNTKEGIFAVYIDSFKLTLPDIERGYLSLNLNKEISIPVFNVIDGILEFELFQYNSDNEEQYFDINEYLNISYNYDNETYIATITLKAIKEIDDFAYLRIKNNIPEIKDERYVDLTVALYNGIKIYPLKPIFEALKETAKIRFEGAYLGLNVKVYSEINYVTKPYKIEYDIDPYTKQKIENSGYILIEGAISDKLKVLAYNDFSYDTCEFEFVAKEDIAELNFIDYSDIIYNDIFSSKIDYNFDYSNDYFYGFQYIDGYKYGSFKVKKILYKVIPPQDIMTDSEALTAWWESLENAETTVEISIRDSFILNNWNKNYKLKAKRAYDNIFEVIIDEDIILNSGETILLKDPNFIIATTYNEDKNGILVKYDEDGNEIVFAKLNNIPIINFEFEILSGLPKISLYKPVDCNDILRLNPNAEDGEYEIYPGFYVQDKSVKVDCIFETDENGNKFAKTIIKSNYIYDYIELTSNVVAYDGTEWKLESYNGVKPANYPDDYNSYDKESYLFIHFPSNIKDIKFNFISKKTDNSIGTIKLCSDDTEIMHVHGENYDFKMILRNNQIIDYDYEMIKKQFAEILDFPNEIENADASINAPLGEIIPDKPKDRFVIISTGSMQGYDVSKFYLNSIEFISEINMDVRDNSLWQPQTEEDKYLLINKYTISTITHPYIISYIKDELKDLGEFINLSTNINKNIISLINPNIKEFIGKYKLDTKHENIIGIYNSNLKSFPINYQLTYDNENIISEINMNTIDLNGVLNSYMNFKSDTHKYIISKINEKILDITNKLNIKNDYTKIINIKELNICELDNYEKINSGNHEFVISNINTNICEINPLVKISFDNEYIISDKNEQQDIIVNNYKLNTTHEFVITLKNSDILEPNNNINLENSLSYIINNIDTNIKEINPDYKARVYHPTVIVYENDNLIEFNISNNYTLSNEPIPFTIYQNATVANDTTEIEIDFRNISTNEYQQTYIIDQKNEPVLETDFRNISTNEYQQTYIIDQKNESVLELDFRNTTDDMVFNLLPKFKFDNEIFGTIDENALSIELLTNVFNIYFTNDESHLYLNIRFDLINNEENEHFEFELNLPNDCIIIDNSNVFIDGKKVYINEEINEEFTGYIKIKIINSANIEVISKSDNILGFNLIERIGYYNLSTIDILPYNIDIEIIQIKDKTKITNQKLPYKVYEVQANIVNETDETRVANQKLPYKVYEVQANTINEKNDSSKITNQKLPYKVYEVQANIVNETDETRVTNQKLPYKVYEVQTNIVNETNETRIANQKAFNFNLEPITNVYIIREEIFVNEEFEFNNSSDTINISYNDYVNENDFIIKTEYDEDVNVSVNEYENDYILINENKLK